MNAAVPCALPPATHTELLAYLRHSGRKLSPAEALAKAVKLWIATDSAVSAPLRGYQWKSVFLPESTQVRMTCNDMFDYAEVVGDELVFRGVAVSPRQMAVEIGGDGRNAWRDLWVRLPGEKNWLRAQRLREREQRQAAQPRPSPEAAITTAARTMSDALNAALVLIEHVDHQSKTVLERRVPKTRREYDTLEDID